jgi:hypothetical protein
MCVVDMFPRTAHVECVVLMETSNRIKKKAPSVLTVLLLLLWPLTGRLGMRITVVSMIGEDC